MKVFVIIPVHNRIGLTLKCLGYLLNQDYPEVKALVVNSGSTDGTSSKIKEQFTQTEILEGDCNLWWTGAMRVGVEHILNVACEGDFIMSLNNDVTCAEDYISSMVKTSIENGRAIVGSIYKKEGATEYTVDGGRVEWKYWNNHYDIPQVCEGNMPEVIENLDFIFGHGTLVPVEVFEKSGNYNDRDLPHYGGDTEFTYRAGKTGFKLVISTRSPLILKEDKDSTGVHFAEEGFISFSKAWDMLFSKRSQANLRDNFKLLDLYCPRKYRLSNKGRIVRMNFAYAFGKTRPFAILRLVAKTLKRRFAVICQIGV